MTNQSNDLRGPEYVRQEFARALEGKGYQLQSLQETDEILRAKLGITDAGQLNVSTPKEVGALLGVDGLIYGELIDFKFVNIGFYQNKFVEANFKMIEVRSGQPLWGDQRKASRKEVRPDRKEAGKAFARGLVEKAAGNMSGTPLYEEVQGAVRMILSTLPRGR